MMSRQFFILLLPALVLMGCTASSRLQSALGNKYKYSVSMTGPERSKDMLFRDEQLMIQFRVDDPGIRFQAQNISPAEMRIDWPKATISIHTMPSPVRNLSTFYDSTKSQPAVQTIPPLGVVRDVILPRGNSYFDGTQWRVDDLLPTTDANSRSMQTTITRMVGAAIELRLPVVCGSESRSYLFSFAVDSVIQIPWREYRPASWIPPHPPVKALRPAPEHQLTAVVIASGFLGFLSYMMTMKKVPVVE